MFPPSSVPYPCTSSRATRIYRTTHRAKIYSEYVIERDICEDRLGRKETGGREGEVEIFSDRYPYLRSFLLRAALAIRYSILYRSHDRRPIVFRARTSFFLPFDGAHRQRGSERAEGRGRQSFTRVRRGSIYRCTGGGMINGRVERCADNIMRRIVPGPTRTEPLALPRPSGPRKEISPGHGGKRVSTSIFRELRVFSNILSFVIFRNVTRLLPRNVESIFDLP